MLGNLVHPIDSVYAVRIGIEAMDDLNFINDRMEGFDIGIRLATLGKEVINGGYFNNIHNIEGRLANNDVGTNTTITGNIQIGTLTAAQIGTATQYNV